MTTESKLYISKASVRAIKQRCLDKLADDATERERYLVGDYEFENRVRDAIHSSEKMPVTFSGFSAATMDVLEAAAERRAKMLKDARDSHDRHSAQRLFEERAFHAIVDELKADKEPDSVADTKAPEVEVQRPSVSAERVARAMAPATDGDKGQPEALPTPAPTRQPAPVVADAARRVVELVDRHEDEAAPVIENLSEELSRSLSAPTPPDPVVIGKLGGAAPVTTKEIQQATAPAPTPYDEYDQRVANAYKRSPPEPKRKKKGGQNGSVFS